MRHNTHTRPEILAYINMLFQVTQEFLTQDKMKTMNSIIGHITDSMTQGLTMRKLDQD